MNRIDGRNVDETRRIKITRGYTKHAEGSVLIEIGDTKVICTASIEDRVPGFLKGSGEGWITAEYGMLPRATGTRNSREAARGKVTGRTSEIQRLIGRSLRSVVDFKSLGERTIWVDCDVIQADGGTRVASITGAFVALVDAINKLDEEVKFETYPIKNYVAAISVGVLEDEVILDLCYEEDSAAIVDMNVVMTDKGEFIELQGTGEERPFTSSEMIKLVSFGEKGINELINAQREALGVDGEKIGNSKKKIDKIIVATNNAHKVDEIKNILSELSIEVISLKDAGIEIEVEEDGKTFEENSYKKASEVKKLTNYATLADDSGLEVISLNLEPGVYSARYAGENATDKENNIKLLKELENKENKDARFVTVLTLITEDGEKIVARGEVEGKIAAYERGENGFGYDPLFIPSGYEKSFSELTIDEKNAISHRAKALENLKSKIKELL